MIINIKNFVPIDECDIEVKPLTVFVGKNSTGKTWTATLIASLFSQSMWRYYFTAYSKKELNERYDIIENAIEQLLDNGTAKINVDQFFENYGNEYLSNVASLLPPYLPKLLGSQKLSFKNLSVGIEVDSVKYRSNIRKTSIIKKVGENETGDAVLELSTQKDDPNIYILTRSRKEIQEMPEYLIRENISSFLFMIIHRAFYKNTRFFPAERTGLQQLISVIHKPDEVDASNEESSIKNRTKAQSSMLINGLLKIIFDACEPGKQSSRQQLAEKNSAVRKYIELSHILENDILGGAVEISEKSDSSTEILFNHKDVDGTFDISPVSSSIKDLISLVLYLRYVAQENDLIVMDEPEMNLHPEAQIKIMEFLSMMVNFGLNVITTTHSPYLVDHISNLTKAHELKKKGKENLEAKFKLKNELCFIDPDNVSVYLFEDKSAKNIFDGDLVDWDTFGNVSEYVSNLYFDL